ncbi:polysaccharide lyase [Falsiroseomonas sp. E2-1-a20]|uniref:polysaccharide lyase n=1 Tax=Falsiroseomonas sp. E2-1-a20 TaxID=3239300 RepID=UPI003F3FBAD1
MGMTQMRKPLLIRCMPRLVWVCVFLVALQGAALAQNSPCGPAYTRVSHLDPVAALQGRSPSWVRNVWGTANIRVLPAEAGAGLILRIGYPRGSINPGNRSAPVGGAGFLLPSGAGAQARCLYYRLRFEGSFDFVRGGKLPGLYGGEAPRGCGPAERDRGFSARLMWREAGMGELYLYAPDRALRCGDSIGRGSWGFARGRWVALAQEVILNTPGREDGVVRVWADGRLVLEHQGLVLRRDATTLVEGVVFSTFFGGSDPSWAPGRDQQADFTGFQIWDRPAER